MHTHQWGGGGESVLVFTMLVLLPIVAGVPIHVVHAFGLPGRGDRLRIY